MAPTSTDRQIVALNFAVMAQHGCILLVVATIVPNIMSTFGIGESVTGLLLAVGALGFMAGPLLAGTVIDRFNVRYALVIGIVIELATLLLFGVAGVFFVAAAANFVMHLGSSFVETGANVIPTLTRSKHSAHSTMNLVHMFFSIGAFVAPFLIGLYVGRTGEWRPVMFFGMIPTGLILLWTVLTRFPKRLADSPVIFGHAEKIPVLRQLQAVLKLRYVILGALALLFYVGAEVGISSWVVYYLQRRLGLSAVASASGLSILWIFMMVGRYLNSALGKRYSSTALVTVSGIGGALGVAAFLFAGSIVPAYALLGWIGLCLSGVFPNVLAELNNRDPRITGTVTAVMSTGAAIGAALFQLLVGFLAETVSLTVAFVVPGVLQLLTVAAFAAAVKAGAGKPT
jgi:fucose permease